MMVDFVVFIFNFWFKFVVFLRVDFCVFDYILCFILILVLFNYEIKDMDCLIGKLKY